MFMSADGSMQTAIAKFLTPVPESRCPFFKSRAPRLKCRLDLYQIADIRHLLSKFGNKTVDGGQGISAFLLAAVSDIR
jgi:hypothetical protein